MSKRNPYPGEILAEPFMNPMGVTQNAYSVMTFALDVGPAPAARRRPSRADGAIRLNVITL